ncbi:beta-Ig-H3 fasciclin [Lecanosticta acicola]|uniref:Beta-Ig-H3 fasciclin, partial n=1 Tax=Lecanosticta acicola TaxID=111012 RepID=A0AAI8Z8F5_9PEZI|nr:beta-Ig-H3 fasciclin [Lecanosticta acicola]
MQFKAILVAAATIASSVAQNTPTLAAALNSTSQLSDLNTLLGQYPSLLATLGNATNLTVLAPSNTALMSLMNSSMANNSQYVQALLSYHVLNMTVRSQNISTTPAFVHTLLNNTMYANVSRGQVVGARRASGNNGTVQFISGLGQRSNVTMADVNVTNGVVHIIDMPLTIPENASSTALAANLTAFAGALRATNLTNTIDRARDYTIFVPSNMAFSSIGSVLPSLSTTQATSLLEYHVLNGTVAYSPLLTSNSTVRSMAGSNLNITNENGEIFVNSARVIAADILTDGGVIHIIDSVLNPNSTLKPNPSVQSGVPAFSGASSGAVPYTSGITMMSQTMTDDYLTMTTDAVAAGYTTAPSGALSSAGAAASSARASSSSHGAAAMPTAAMGAAALFGGAAWMANF